MFGIATPVRVGSNSFTASNTTIAVTVGASGVPVGARIIVALHTNNANTDPAQTCADSRGNTYGVEADSGAASRRLTAFSAPITTALVTGDTITATLGAATGRAAMDVFYATGVGALDVSGTRSDATGSATPTSDATAARTRRNSLVVGICGWTPAGAGETLTAGSGFGNANTVDASSGGITRTLGTEWGIFSVLGGTDAATCTITASHTYSMFALVYPESATTWVSGDWVQETTTTTGTGDITLAGAASNRQALSAVAANGDSLFYDITHQSATEREVGYGKWVTGGTLQRTRVIASTNSGSAVSFSAGTKDVFCTFPAMQGIATAVTRYQTTDVFLPDGASVTVTGGYKIAYGKTLRIGAGGVLGI